MIFWKSKPKVKEEVDFNSESWKKWKDNPAYLQGFVISLISDFNALQKENTQLRNNEGVWLSPEEVHNFNKLLDELKLK